MENVNELNESFNKKDYDLTDGLIKAWIPLTRRIETPDAIKYAIDTTGTSLYFLKKDDATFLQIEFKIAGLKIEPQNPRPVGFPIGKCKIPLRANSEKSGGMTIPKDVQLEADFVGLRDDRLKTGSFKLLIPVTDAVIEEVW